MLSSHLPSLTEPQFSYSKIGTLKTAALALGTNPKGDNMEEAAEPLGHTQWTALKRICEGT